MHFARLEVPPFLFFQVTSARGNGNRLSSVILVPALVEDSATAHAVAFLLPLSIWFRRRIVW